MHAAVDPHRVLHLEDRITSAAISVSRQFYTLAASGKQIMHDARRSWCPCSTQHGTVCTDSGSLSTDARMCAALGRIPLLLQHLVYVLLQRRLTFQWDVWDGPPLPSLAALDQATCRFLQTAADSLTSSSTHTPRSGEQHLAGRPLLDQGAMHVPAGLGVMREAMPTTGGHQPPLAAAA